MSPLIRKAGDLPRKSLWSKIKDVALTDVPVFARGGAIQGSLDSLEELLLDADFGVSATLALTAEVEAQARRGFIKTQDDFLRALSAGIASALRKGKSDTTLHLSGGK